MLLFLKIQTLSGRIVTTTYYESYSGWYMVEVDRVIRILSQISSFLKFSESIVSLDDKYPVQVYTLYLCFALLCFEWIASNQVFNRKGTFVVLSLFLFL